MRLVMMGTGPFAVPTFENLFATTHEVVALVASPLKVSVREGIPFPAPCRDVAQQHGLPIFDPENVNTAEAQAAFREFAADLFVVCDYGQILSGQTLAAARLGGINLHASLLPKYRGAAPINWALYHGETDTGVSVIHMTPKVDAGPIIAQRATPIDPAETAVELEPRLARIGAELVCQTLDAVEQERTQVIPQDAALASKAPRLKKTDGLIDWTRPARAIQNQYRALQPWPKTFTFWHRAKGPPLRMIVGPLEVETHQADVPPGTVLEAANDRLVVAAADAAVVIRGVQPAGKRLLAVGEFLRGQRIQPSDRFGAEEKGGA